MPSLADNPLAALTTVVAPAILTNVRETRLAVRTLAEEAALAQDRPLSHV